MCTSLFDSFFLSCTCNTLFISLLTSAQARLRAELKHISKRSEKKLTRIPLLAASEQGSNQQPILSSDLFWLIKPAVIIYSCCILFGYVDKVELQHGTFFPFNPFSKCNCFAYGNFPFVLFQFFFFFLFLYTLKVHFCWNAIFFLHHRV